MGVRGKRPRPKRGVLGVPSRVPHLGVPGRHLVPSSVAASTLLVPMVGLASLPPLGSSSAVVELWRPPEATFLVDEVGPRPGAARREPWARGGALGSGDSIDAVPVHETPAAVGNHFPNGDYPFCNLLVRQIEQSTKWYFAPLHSNF